MVREAAMGQPGGQERETRGDTAGETIKLVIVEQNQMSGEATDGQRSRGSGWGIARGDKVYPILCWFPSDVSGHKDTVIIKWLTRCWSSLLGGKSSAVGCG